MRTCVTEKEGGGGQVERKKESALIEDLRKKRKKNSLLDERVALVGDVHQLRPDLALGDDGLEGSC